MKNIIEFIAGFIIVGAITYMINKTKKEMKVDENILKTAIKNCDNHINLNDIEDIDE